MLERVESPRSRHTAVELRGAIGGRICCQQSSEHTNRRLNSVLEKESPASQHTAVLLGCVEARCPRRYRLCASGVVLLFLFFIDTVSTNRPPQNRGLNLWLERVESPGSRCRYLEKKKGGDTLVAGYVAGDGGVTGISAHSYPTGLRGVTLSGTSRFHRYCEHSSKQRGCSSRGCNRLDLGVLERKSRPISLSHTHTHT